MKKSLLIAAFFALYIIACSNAPSSSLIEDEFDIIDKNLKIYLGEDYSAVNFVIINKDYLDANKTEFLVEFVYDINKPVFGYEAKKLPGSLKFKYANSKWECVENSCLLMGIFQLGKK